MSANLENSAVARGLEKISLHSNPKERQYQRMLKLLHHCTHLTGSIGNAYKSLREREKKKKKTQKMGKRFE